MSDFPTPATAMPFGMLQQLDTDLQQINVSLGQIAQLLTALVALQSGQIVTGSRGGNLALASLLTALANANVIVDNTTA